MNLHISLAPETVFELGSFHITNSFLMMLIVTAVVLVVFLTTRFKFKEIPGRFQGLVEMLFEEGLGFIDSIMENKERTKKVFPLVFTLFSFILFANLANFIPGQFALTIAGEEGPAHLFRAVMADYGMVLVMTMIAVITVQIVAIIIHGPFGYLRKFFNFKSPLAFFLGILEIIGELAKILSLSFRLFGNIFAEEVLAMVILFLAPFFIPLPFLFLALLFSFIQAFVFSVLTLVFISLAVNMEAY